MKYIVYTILVFIVWSPCWAWSTEEVQSQVSPGDSLEAVLDTIRSYQGRIQVLEELSDYYSYTDKQKAMYYANEIKVLAAEKGDDRGVGIAPYRMGGVYFESYEIDSAIFEYEQAEQFLRNDTSYLAQHTLARVWHNHGAMYQRKGDIDTYLEFLLDKAIPIQERIGEEVGLGKNYHAIGLVFQSTTEFERAIYYHEKAIDILQDKSHVPELIDAYTMAVESYFLSDDYQGERLTTIDNYLQTADSLLNLYPDTYSYLLYLEVLGMYQETIEEDLEKALAFYLQGNKLAVENRMQRIGIKALSRAYYVYDKLGEHETALAVLRQNYVDFQSYLTPRDRNILLRNMSSTLEKLGRITEAYAMQKEYVALNDSLHRVEMAYKVHNLERKYEAQVKEVLALLPITELRFM